MMMLAIQSNLPDRIIESALTGLAPTSRRVYRARILAWIAWARGSPLDREHVNRYLRSLELTGRSPQVRNQSLAALKRLAAESAELSALPPEIASQIGTIKSKRILGIRTGRWLTAQQTAALLLTPDRRTTTGKRDIAVLILLVACGLRRAEACALETSQVQFVNGKLLLVNLTGKGNRTRTVCVPGWAHKPIEDWIKEIKK
jgi:integrase/recombinase XerD